MKKNTAILDTFKKIITFNFNGEDFVVDLKEGDLHDSWNCIETTAKVTFDVNFTWEDSDLDPHPAFSVYSLIDNGDGTWSTNWSDDTSIKIKEILGDKNQYFRDKPYEFNPLLPTRFEVFNGKDELQLKTKKFNLAVDTAGSAKFLKKEIGWYVVAIDSNGARKNLG